MTDDTDCKPHPPESPALPDVLTYSVSWPVYALAHCANPLRPFTLAFSSFIEDPSNQVEVVRVSEESGRFERVADFEHVYPPTKLMWMPNATGQQPDLIASSTDSLRIWQFGEEQPLKSNLINARSNAPLTSFDWNAEDTNMLATSSIDTTCTVWDLEKEAVRTQMIAHDKEVYDIAFAKGINTFASVGADGSVRHFDLRNLEHSSILYESQGEFTPLIRLAWNKVNPFYLAALAMDSNVAMILDMRGPPLPVTELHGHQGSINAVVWSPTSPYHLCTAGDDNQAIIWNLQKVTMSAEGERTTEPAFVYTAMAEIPAVQWPNSQPDWISIAFNKCVQVVKI